MSSQRLEDDLVAELRTLYDSSLPDIATLTLRTHNRPRPNAPAQPNRVTVIYGMRAVNTGPMRQQTEPLPNSVIFRRDNTPTVDIWPTENLQDDIVIPRTPLLFRRGDDLNVEFTPRHVDEGATRDWTNGIQLLGNVVEALGNVVTGPIEDFGRFTIGKSKKKGPDPESVARKLLLSYLSKEQKELWRKRRKILVRSKIRPAFTYEIMSHEVRLVDDQGVCFESYCMVAGEPGIPNSDIVLSKYLLLESNEEKFLQIANRTVHRRPRQELAYSGMATQQEYGYYQPQTADERLRARRDTIDIDRIGLQSGLYTGLTPIDVRALEDSVIRFASAQAMIDGIAETPNGLAVRDILPDRDLNRRRRL